MDHLAALRKARAGKGSNRAGLNLPVHPRSGLIPQETTPAFAAQPVMPSEP
jgi:hypothetical protein